MYHNMSVCMRTMKTDDDHAWFIFSSHSCHLRMGDSNSDSWSGPTVPSALILVKVEDSKTSIIPQRLTKVKERPLLISWNLSQFRRIELVV